eukprot:scaffold2663_cov73-Cylindrotheca_fusiformis.AAC.6
MKTMRRIRRRNNNTKKNKQVVLVFIVATFLVSIFVHQFHPTATVSEDDYEMMVHFHQQQLHKVDGGRIHQNTEMTTNNHSNNSNLVLQRDHHHHQQQAAAATRIRKCLEQRGTNGYWFIDDDFSRKTFYRHGPRSSQWAKSNAGYVPNRTYVGNQYNWKDNIETLLQCRPMEAVTFSSFCKIMMALNIRRIIFVGDSLAMSQRDSLFKLMKIPKPKGRHIECPTTTSTDPYFIKFRFFRENLGPNYNIQNTSTSSVMDEYNNNSTTTTRNKKKKYDRMQAGPEIAFCNGEPMLNNSNNNYCSWHIEYNAHPEEKTLLVLNQGAHFHSMETFSNSIDEFVKNFNNNNNNANNNNKTMPQQQQHSSGDIIIFRSTVPGHWDCFNKYKPPIDVLNMTHDKFLDRYSTTKYDWNLFDTYYNPYAKRTLEHNLVALSSPRKQDITFHYLNVYNMTILRTDEHVSEKDCLHYVSPGPVDFWNHLMLTNLADMVELLQLGKE